MRGYTEAAVLGAFTGSFPFAVRTGVVAIVDDVVVVMA